MDDIPPPRFFIAQSPEELEVGNDDHASMTHNRMSYLIEQQQLLIERLQATLNVERKAQWAHSADRADLGCCGYCIATPIRVMLGGG